jgi:hypothetical protein
VTASYSHGYAYYSGNGWQMFLVKVGMLTEVHQIVLSACMPPEEPSMTSGPDEVQHGFLIEAWIVITI